MNTPGPVTYRFLPWVRQGVSGAVSVPDTLGAGVADHATLSVRLRVNTAESVEARVRLYGPGEVVGLDPRVVIRTEPRHLTLDFEPNYFPTIEFDQPDFPWLFTPAAANPHGRLRPWLCLVVVPQQEDITLLPPDPLRPLPVLECPRDQLPDLGESWAWAHAQVVGPRDGLALDQIFATRPEQTISRLLCPRKLEPHTRYDACLVPTFEAGRKAGLGEPTEDAQELRPAWSTNAPGRVRLPVYYQWEFGTGAGGDFEALARRLQARPLPPQVGLQEMHVLPLAPHMPGAVLGLEGALRPPHTPSTPWPDEARQAFQERLQQLLNAAGTLRAPVVTPPLYGRWHAAQPTVPAHAEPPSWLRELNLDPRYRAAAGLGTLVIQNQQEQLMASAWEQVGELERANQTLRQAQLARGIGLSLYEKRVQKLRPDLLVQISGPAHGRLRLTDRQTLRQQVRQSALPESAVSTPFRRLTRPRGAVGRRLSPTGQPRVFVQRLAEGTLAAAPPRQPPQGLVTPESVSEALKSARPTTMGKMLNLRFADAMPAARQTAPTRPDFAVVLEQFTVSKPGTTTNVGAERLVAARFQAAATAHQTRLIQATARPTAPSRPLLPLQEAQFRAKLLEGLDPRRTIRDRVLARLRMPAMARKPEDDPLEPVMAAPQFPQPMYEPLRDLSQDFLLPGLEHVPPDTISLVETNPRFIEAYMVGLNHEMGRELLWREYPTDQRGTSFQRFWGITQDDIAPIHTWPAANPLGRNLKQEAQGHLVLLIRGGLLRRYPTAVLYVVKAVWSADQQHRQLSAEERYPRFRGTLAPDVTFLGFDLTEAEARGTPNPEANNPGWFFVIQEQPTAPRFGLDAVEETAPRFGGEPTSWRNLSWGHVVADESAFRALTYVRVLAQPQVGWVKNHVVWGRNAAHMASITLQRLVRIAMHADTLLPPQTAVEG